MFSKLYQSKRGQFFSNKTPLFTEFNPDELVWANLKRVQIPNRFAKNKTELTEIANIGMNNIKNNPQLVASFFNDTNFYFTK